MKGLSYTQRTLRELRDRGVIVGKTEQFNQHAGPFGIRQDLFGFIDMIALYPGDRGIVAIQSTGPSGHQAHKRKIIEECTDNAIAWLQSGGKIELWSWRKLLLKRGGKAKRWTPRVEEITMANFETGEEE